MTSLAMVRYRFCATPGGALLRSLAVTHHLNFGRVRSRASVQGRMHLYRSDFLPVSRSVEGAPQPYLWSAPEVGDVRVVEQHARGSCLGSDWLCVENVALLFSSLANSLCLQDQSSSGSQLKFCHLEGIFVRPPRLSFIRSFLI